MSINPTAATGFERGASAYERSRPSYPPAVIDAVPRDGLVVDVAAGTGKLTRQLVDAGASVIAVEPVEAMRRIAAAHAPAVAGTAEQLPLRDGVACAITVAQAFHWFDGPRAFAEIRRVLAPGGTLLAVWNERDNRVPWVAAMSEVIHAHDPGAYQTDVPWEDLAAADGGFSTVERVEVDNSRPGTDVDSVVERALSTSYIAAADGAIREQVARDVRAIVAGFDEPFEYPYVTQIFTCRRA